MDGRWAVGIDIGRTNLRAGLVGGDGAVVRELRERTDVAGGPDGVAAQVVRAVRELAGGRTLVGVGVGIAGQCDVERGIVRYGPNLFWPDVPFRERLEAAVGLPVVLRNDVVMATVGEWRHGAGRGCGDLVVLMVGTGIGGGAVVDGRLLRGASGLGGHFGHVSVQMDGPECGCGRRGCVEAYASGCGLAARAASAPELGSSILSREEVIDGAAVARAAAAGDPLASRLRDEAAAALSSAVGSVVNCLNPRRVVLGGTVVRGLPGTLELVAREAAARCLPSHRDRLEIVPAELGDRAGMVGAASWALLPP